MRIGKHRSSGEAQRALEDATRRVQEVKSRNGEVKEIADALRVIRHKNHFAEQIAILMVRDVRKGL